MIGKRYGRLIVIADAPRSPKREIVYRCRCDCGKELEVPGCRIRAGHSKSCGCLSREITAIQFTTHGQTKGNVRTPEYQAWVSMLSRVRAKHGEVYRAYGARGITVCERWKFFEHFFSDMGAMPNAKLTLDRINNDGNYEPANCRWATRGQQMHNRRPRTRSGHVGVYWVGHSSKWMAKIVHDCRPYYLGCYSDVAAAISAYETALAKIASGVILEDRCRRQ